MRKVQFFFVVVVSALLLAGIRAAGTCPFRDLPDDGIHSAVLEIYAEKPYELTGEECAALAERLRKIVIYRRDDSYTEYCGTGATFTVTFADGSQTVVSDGNPFFIIDGKGYRTKYAPCEELNRFAFSLNQWYS